MFTEDLTPFFNTSEHATAATLNGVAVRGIFDRAYMSAGSGAGLASSVPTFTLPSAHVSADAVGQPLVVSGEAFTVAASEPDGTGITVLLLEVAA